MDDLTISARVEALLLVSLQLEISNLQVETRGGEVYVSGVILAEGIRDRHRMIKKDPRRDASQTYFVVTPPEHYLYARWALE